MLRKDSVFEAWQRTIVQQLVVSHMLLSGVSHIFSLKPIIYDFLLKLDLVLATQVGVGNGRYGNLTILTDEASDSMYAEQVTRIRSKWRNFGEERRWADVKID